MPNTTLAEYFREIDEVSEAVGYLDISFFRRLFKRLTGLTPGKYRRMFQPLQLANT
jgi:YesN/AraC family two-component response regulator